MIRLLLIYFTCVSHTGSNLPRKRALNLHEETTKLQVQKWDVPVCKVPRRFSFWMVKMQCCHHPRHDAAKRLFPKICQILQAPLLHHFSAWRWLLERSYPYIRWLDVRTQEPVWEGILAEQRWNAGLFLSGIMKLFSIICQVCGIVTWILGFMQACEAEVTSKKATLARLETTVVAHGLSEETRWLCLIS